MNYVLKNALAGFFITALSCHAIHAGKEGERLLEFARANPAMLPVSEAYRIISKVHEISGNIDQLIENGAQQLMEEASEENDLATRAWTIFEPIYNHAHTKKIAKDLEHDNCINFTKYSHSKSPEKKFKKKIEKYRETLSLSKTNIEKTMRNCLGSRIAEDIFPGVIDFSLLKGNASYTIEAEQLAESLIGDLGMHAKQVLADLWPRALSNDIEDKDCWLSYVLNSDIENYASNLLSDGDLKVTTNDYEAFLFHRVFTALEIKINN